MSNIDLKDRAKFIGASEVASLFYAWRMPDDTITYRHLFENHPEGATCIGCLSTYKTGYRMFFEKKGTLASDFEENERVDAGTYLEPAIAEWARNKFGLNLRKVRRYIKHPEVKGLGQSRDYEEVSEGYPPVEIKNVDFLVFRDNYISEKDEITDAPFDKLLQPQAQMAGTKAPYAWLIVNVAGNNLKRMKVMRNDAVIHRIEEAARAFWTAMAEGREPSPIFDVDAQAVIDLHQSAIGNPPLDLRGHNRLPAVCQEYKAAAAAAKDADERKQAALAEIYSIIGDAAAAITAGFKISAGMVAETMVSYTRKAYRNPRITELKGA